MRGALSSAAVSEGWALNSCGCSGSGEVGRCLLSSGVDVAVAMKILADSPSPRVMSSFSHEGEGGLFTAL